METWRNLKYAVGTRSGIMYSSCKEHKKCVDGYPPFRTILSTLKATKHKLADCFSDKS